MSYCREEGKDKIIFVTQDDHSKPSNVALEEDADQEPGLILPNGDINWNCPCLGGMSTGPCGFEFRSAFSCFHTSQADPRGSDCFEDFRKMQECFVKYPNLYGSDKDDEESIALGEEMDKQDLINKTDVKSKTPMDTNNSNNSQKETK